MGPVESGWSGKGCSSRQGTVYLVRVTRVGAGTLLPVRSGVGSFLCGPGPVAPQMGGEVSAQTGAKAWPLSCF